MELIDIIKELNMSNGYQVALMSTYSCDISFINKVIITKLLDQGCNKIVLFVDRRMLTENLIQNGNVTIGSKYIINPIKTDYAFHPKVFLLLGKDKAKVMIGSGNLTCAGMLSNTETFTKYEYDESNTEHLGMIKNALDMFKNIAKENYFPLQDKVFEAITEFKYLNRDIQKNRTIWWMDNCREEIVKQVLAQVNEKIKSLDIVVPYFDAKCEAVTYLVDSFNIAKCSVYVQNHNSNLKPNKLASNINAYCFNEFNGSDKFYHAKVFIFYGMKYDYVLYGSANCSTRALYKTKKLGNYEACVFEKGNKGDFDYYLKCIEQSNELEKETFISIDNTFKNQYQNTFFEYALLTINGLEIVLRQNKPISIEGLHINNKVVSFNQKQDNISILLKKPEEIIDEKTVFEMTVYEKGKDAYQLIGWYLDDQSIMYTHDNRKEIIRQMVTRGLWTSDLSCILDIICEFNEKVCWSYDDLTQSNEYIKKKHESEIEMSKIINDNRDEYIVDDVIINSDFVNSRNSRSLLHVFYEFGVARYTQNRHEKQLLEKAEVHNKQLETEKFDVGYTNYDKKWLAKQFNRLLNSYYKSLSDKAYMKEVSWNSFWEKNIAVLEFVHKLIKSEGYTYLKSCSDIDFYLDESELVMMCSELLEAIVKYNRQNDMTDEHKQVLISKSIYSIIWMYFNNDELTNESVFNPKRALDNLRQLVDDDVWFRDKYLSFLPTLENSSILGTNFKECEMVECFEKLFSYHSLSTASDRLKSILGETFAISGDKHLEVVINLASKMELFPFDGQIKAKVKETIITMCMVKTWKESSLITVKFITDVGKIRKYSICYSSNLQKIKENILYDNGTIYDSHVNRLEWGL